MEQMLAVDRTSETNLWYLWYHHHVLNYKRKKVSEVAYFWFSLGIDFFFSYNTHSSFLEAASFRVLSLSLFFWFGMFLYFFVSLQFIEEAGKI